MPIVLGGLALLAAVVFTIGVATTIAKPSSTSTTKSNLLSDIADAKKNFDQSLKNLMILGTVTILVTIFSKSEKKKQQEEALNNISSAGAASSAANTAAMMNNVKNIVDQVQSEKAQASNMTAVDTSGIPHFNPFPVAEQEGPKIYDTPITEQKTPEPLVFPRVDQEPIILSFPHEDTVKPQLDPFPAERPRELGDIILWAERNVWGSEVPDYVKDNRVPLDKETALSSKEYQKTNIKVKGAQVYKKGDYYYYRDTFHTGEASHLEVFDKRGKHIGEANPQTGELTQGTADPTKKINVK